jgi:hypothetical protein
MKYPCSSWLVLAALPAIGALAGCQRGSQKIAEGEQYPAALPHGPTMNVQVFRRETQIEFTNTTAQPIPPSRLWLNAWYSHEFPGLGVGQTVVIPLREFKDRYGDPFRGGGFFATEPPDRLALAEVEAGGHVAGMVVVGGE